MAVNTYTTTGTKATVAAKLDKAVFGVDTDNHELLKLAYDAYLANGRGNYAVTKTRAEVSGGGRKPWKQKGTGNARVGSTRSPIWRSGGITFGPTGNENYTKGMNVKAKRLAIRQALTIAATDNKISVIEDLVSKEGKTSETATLLKKLGANRRTLLVVNTLNPELLQSVRNLQDVKVIKATYLNVFDTLNADAIVFTTEALTAATEWLSAATVKPPKGTN
jgi:large subunit ribosomal protein L4